ncbi:MAG TPA: WD40 repeat domain-containing protein, partial [Pyrinomonadaceae bacterium]|nr:WD40 repeat domain-containing protein [Pyrinomonadaceae bacterium]
MGSYSHRLHTRAGSFLLSILALLVLATGVSGQSPTPEKRDLGLQANQQPNSQSNQAGTKEPKPELVLQTGYSSFYGATRLGFSPDGRLLATATFHTNTIKLWETATGRELRNLSTGGQNTMNLSPVFAFSPDSRLLAAAGGSNSISIWDVTTGRDVQTLTSAAGGFMGALGVSFVGFSNDGRRLVTISDSIHVWDASTWREATNIQSSAISPGGFTGGGGGVALSADGNQLARVDNDQIKFFDTASGKELRTVSLPDSRMQDIELSFTSDGRLLAAGVNDKKLKVWDVNSKSEHIQAPTRKDFALIKFSSDGRLVAVADDYLVRIWEASSGKQLSSIAVPNSGVYQEVGGVFAAFTPDGKRLATSGFGTQTYLWDVDTGKQVQQMKGRTNMAYAVAFSEDGTQLTSGGRTRWDLRTGQGRRLSSSMTDKQFGVPSPDGKLIAMFAPNTSAVTIYEATTGKTLQTLSRANFDGGVERVRFGQDGRSLAVVYSTSQGVQTIGRLPSSELKIWDAVDGRELQTLLLSTTPVETSFSSDGKMIATVSTQGEITLWDIASGSRLRSLTTSAGQSYDPTSMMKNMPTPGQMRRGQMPNIQMPNMDQMNSMITNMLGTMTAGTKGRNVSSVTFSRDGSVLASGGIESKSNFDMTAMMNQAKTQKPSKNQPQPGTDEFLKNLKIETTGQLVLWNPATGQQLGAIKGHGKAINNVAFSRDAKLIASAGTDNTIKIWDVATQRELRTLTGHTAGIESMDFSPDGKLLASASDDGSTFLWDANTGEHLLTLISLDDGGEWMVVTPEGLFDGTPQSWNQILWRYKQDTFNVAPVDWFFNEYYYPGLLSEVFMGKRPKVALDISKKDRRQPIVKLSIPGNGATENISTRTLKVKIEIADAAPDEEHKQGSGARDLRLFRNGSLVKVWHGDALKGQAATAIEEEMTLVAGPNRLTAYAFNNDNVKSKDANLLLTGADSLKRAGTAWVIAVGVNEYANSQYNLKYAVAD